MSLFFTRISEIISANVNDLLDRVEDPERMIKQIIREMEENLVQAREGVVDAIASEKQLGKELGAQQSQAEQWRARAEQAVQAGNDALARECLLRKQEHEAVARSLESSWGAAKQTSARLKTQLKALESKLEEVRRKRGGLVARQRAAQARACMDTTLAKVDAARDMQASFVRMEHKVGAMEAELEAREEVYDGHSELERELLRMQVDQAVDNELAELKRTLGGDPPAP